jgi:hypothetical protein
MGEGGWQIKRRRIPQAFEETRIIEERPTLVGRFE